MEQVPPPLPARTGASSSASLSARLFNVFATPGDVFAEVSASPSYALNWLVPVLVSCVVGLAAVWVVFSQETILHQMEEQRDRALEKKLARMPKEQQEQVRQMAEKFSSPTLLRVSGSFGAVAGSFVSVFIMGLVIWAFGRLAFKAHFPFMKAVEVCGLASMINILNGIVTTLLVVSLGTMYVSPGPSLLIREPDPTNKLHLLASACNVMTIWYVGVLAIGLGKLSGRSAWKSFAWLLGLWALFRGGLIAAGVGMQ
jgi:hypothetical protein